jgi:serine protease
VLLRLALPAALIAVALTPVTGSPVAAAPPEPAKSKFSHPVRSGDPGKAAYAPNSVVVKFRKTASTSARQKALSKHGSRSTTALTGTYVSVTADSPAPELLKKLKAEPAVELASLNYVRKAAATPNDELYADGDQNYLKSVRLPEAWNLSKSAGAQTIAVLDTGIDSGHPDLTGRIVGSYNTIHPGWAATDGYGHGTFVSGIAAATTNNTIGVAGAAWTGRLLAVKVLDDEGSGTDANIAAGITWAASHGARIINMSLSGPGDGLVLHDAIKAATAKGILVVAAAGNRGDDMVQYPAAYPEVLAVGAADANGALTDFSSTGDWVDITAPGWDITSTHPRALTPPGYLPYALGGAGTSFSTPMVAAVAAMVRNKFTTLTPAQTIARLKATARDAGPRGLDPYYGAGFLDAYNALGGPWGAEYWMAGPDGDDLPAGAKALSTSTTGFISTEGDVDWYWVDSTAPRNLTFTVTPPPYVEGKAQNMDAVVSAYNSQLHLLGTADSDDPGATERLSISVTSGRTFIAVRNWNGSRDGRSYSLSVAGGSTPSSFIGEQLWVWDAKPVSLGANAPLTSSPTVTFYRELDPATVNTSTVRLLHGRSGAVVPSTVSYDATTKTATIKPNSALQDNTPYRISVGAVRDTGGWTFTGFSSTFRTVDAAPAAVTGFDATGQYAQATLKWTLPSITDLDQVIVRRNTGTTPPASPTTGTAVYAGGATTATATGLANSTTYTFRAWVRDKAGKFSAPVDTRLVGTRASIAVTTSAINYGGSVTITGKVTRLDNGAPLAVTPISLYARTKNSSTWREVTRMNSSATGTVSHVHKPLVSTVYQWGYNGSPDLLGSRTGNATVEVRPLITAYLSATSFRLGGSTAFYGYLRPQHPGQTVYLQRSISGTWTNITTGKLNTTGNYGFTIKPTVRGTYSYRVVWLADGDHATTVSATKSFTVS